MKKWLPHLVYAGLLVILSAGFEWLRYRENKLVDFLNRPTDEAYEETMRANRTLADEIRFTAEAHPNTRNILIFKQIGTTDSLVTAALAGPDERDSLAGRLWGLAGKEPVLESFFRRPDPGTVKAFARSSYRKTYLQNDSLRIQMMCLEVLKHFQQQASGLDIICFSTDPVASFTTLCPRVGESFRADFLLNDIRWQRWIGDLAVRVNGMPVPLTDGLANFTTVFKKPGSKILKVEMQIQNPLTREIKTYIKEFQVEVF